MCKTINIEASIMFVRLLRHSLLGICILFPYVYHSASCCESLGTKQSHGSPTTIPIWLILILTSPHQPGTHGCPCLGKTVIINALTEPRVDLHHALSHRAPGPRPKTIPTLKSHWDAWLSNPHLGLLKSSSCLIQVIHVKSPSLDE